MTSCRWLTTALVVLGIISAAALSARGDETMAPSIPAKEDVLKTLNKTHPRLIATAEDFTALRRRVIDDPVARKWWGKLHAEADGLLKAPPSKYEIPDGKRLLATSRRVVDRVYTLALAYRLTGDQRYADRAWTELEAAAAFKDWNPPHFLDTAEMTHAFAVGYDWLYDVWTPEQRAALRKAIITLGLEPALACYQGTGKSNWWPKVSHNWNQVCNGGIAVGALAIADDEPALASDILKRALDSLPLAMKSFAPDGAWAEGPGYWHYAVRYNVYFLAALETALGTDFGLSRMQGFDQTGWFPICLVGPLNLDFNFADAHQATTVRAEELFWLARRFNQPAFARYEVTHASPNALDLVWYRPELLEGGAKAPPANARYFRESEVVTARSAWNDPQATFLAFKAGDNKVNHSHLDIGTFILDAAGERWAVDLGSDNYNMPAYFGDQRWTYYRLRAEGHNTLVINPDQSGGQDPKAATRISRFQSTAAGAVAEADLTAAYAASGAKSVRRTMTLDGRAVTVADAVELAEPGHVWWFMHTPALITLQEGGRRAVLTLGDKHLAATLVSPEGARFEIKDASPLPSSPNPSVQAIDKDVRKLTIHLPDVTKTNIEVRLAPAE